MLHLCVRHIFSTYNKVFNYYAIHEPLSSSLFLSFQLFVIRNPHSKHTFNPLLIILSWYTIHCPFPYHFQSHPTISFSIFLFPHKFILITSITTSHSTLLITCPNHLSLFSLHLSINYWSHAYLISTFHSFIYYSYFCLTLRIIKRRSISSHPCRDYF